MEQKDPKPKIDDKKAVMLAEEFTNAILKRLADEGAMITDIPLVMATTVVLMIETLTQPTGCNPIVLYEGFDHAMDLQKKLAECVKAKIAEGKAKIVPLNNPNV